MTEVIQPARVSINSLYNTAYPDIIYRIEDMVAEEAKVAFRITIQGTNMGNFRNLAPTSKKITISRFAIIYLKNGKFSEGWILEDSLGMYQQLAFLPSTDQIGK